MTCVQLVERGPVRTYAPGVARAMLRRESQSRALADRLRALYQDSELEKRRASGLNIRMALDISAQSGGLFDGNFATLFRSMGLTPYQVVQTDLGPSYGTLLPAGVSPPTVVLGGTLAAGLPFRPILFKVATTGALNTWTANAYIDGVGTTIDQTFTSAATVNLTGNLLGLILTISAGAAVASDQWTATWAGLSDQSGNGLNYSQGTTAQQPTVGVGVNGKASILTAGGASGAQRLVSSLNLPAPGTTPWTALLVARWLGTTHAFNAVLVSATGATNGAIVELASSAAGYNTFNGGSTTTTGTDPATTFSRFRAYFSNSTSDALKVGSAADLTGVNAGNSAFTGRQIGANGTAINGLDAEVMMVAYLPGRLTPSQLSIFDAACNSSAGYGAGNVRV